MYVYECECMCVYVGSKLEVPAQVFMFPVIKNPGFLTVKSHFTTPLWCWLPCCIIRVRIENGDHNSRIVLMFSIRVESIGS